MKTVTLYILHYDFVKVSKVLTAVIVTILRYVIFIINAVTCKIFNVGTGCRFFLYNLFILLTGLIYRTILIIVHYILCAHYKWSKKCNITSETLE